MGLKGGSTTQTMTPDEGTQNWVKQYRTTLGNVADSYFQNNPNASQSIYDNPNFQQGEGILQRAGQGDVSQFMNPFENNVVQGVQSDFDRQRAGAVMQAGDAATKAGAFGGSRSAVLQNLGQRDINQSEANTLAQLRYSGYQGAQQYAQQAGGNLANLGMGSNAQSYAQLQQMLAAQQSGEQGGGYSTTTQQQGSLLGTLAGLAGVGASFIPGVGGAVGKAANLGMGGAGAPQIDPSAIPSNPGFDSGPNYGLPAQYDANGNRIG